MSDSTENSGTKKEKNIFEMNKNELAAKEEMTKNKLNEKMKKLNEISKTRIFINPVYSRNMSICIDEVLTEEQQDQKNKRVISTFKYCPPPTSEKISSVANIKLKTTQYEKSVIPNLQLECNQLKSSYEQILKKREV